MRGFAPRSERGLAKVVLAVTSAFTMSLVATLLVPAMHASAAVNYAAEGDIDGSTPGRSVTEGSFIVSCTDIPPTQGTDAFVFELPAAGNGEIAKATPVTTEGPGDPDLDLHFYGDDCEEKMPRAATADAAESGPLPAGTKFVVVISFQNDLPVTNTHVCLTVGSAVCGAASPSGDTSASASSSASASAGASSSASSSASSGSSPTTGSSPSSTAATSTISTTIESSKSITKYKKKFTLSGRVTFGEGCQRPFEVTVRKRVAGTSSSQLLQSGIPVERDETWQISTKSKTSATYTATVTAGNPTVCQSAEEASTNVQTRVAISFGFALPCHAPQAISGKVKPRHPKTKVLLKHKSGAKFKTVDKDKLSKRSGYEMTIPSCSGKYQVVWPAQGQRNAAGKRSFHL